MIESMPETPKSALGLRTAYLGLRSYDEGLSAQSEALATLETGTAGVVLGLEHHPVITLGVRGNSTTDLMISASTLADSGFEVHQTTRGGQATLHNPGQLVIYPCLNLKTLNLGARAYVELIQNTTLSWLQSLGVEAQTGETEPGVFVRGAKLAAFGFRISRGLTSHGLAINVANELASFDLIRTCGVSGQKVTRLRDLHVDEPLEALFLSWMQSFERALTAPPSHH